MKVYWYSYLVIPCHCPAKKATIEVIITADRLVQAQRQSLAQLFFGITCGLVQPGCAPGKLVHVARP
eukprot:scaffold268488_cov53-Prasinocladus_malaysianus.AAC.2